MAVWTLCNNTPVETHAFSYASKKCWIKTTLGTSLKPFVCAPFNIWEQCDFSGISNTLFSGEWICLRPRSQPNRNRGIWVECDNRSKFGYYLSYRIHCGHIWDQLCADILWSGCTFCHTITCDCCTTASNRRTINWNSMKQLCNQMRQFARVYNGLKMIARLQITAEFSDSCGWIIWR